MKEKERSRIKTVQMDNLRGLLGIRRMYRVPNAWIRELCGVKKGLDERIDQGVLQWFGHVERTESDRIAKIVYVGDCAGSSSLRRPRKRWIEIKNRGLDVRKARRMVQDKSECRGFVRGECMGRSPGDELLTLTRCHSFGLKPLKGGSPSVAKPTT